MMTILHLTSAETAELFAALVRSNEAFGEDPIWENRTVTWLFGKQENAGRAGMQYGGERPSDGGPCTCRLVPATPD